jgi:hypothetical protein
MPGRVRHAGRAGRIVAPLVALLALALAAGPAVAAPVQVWLRVEGQSATLFEGPVWSDGHAVDGGDGSGSHPCGGAGPTPIAALADAGLDWRGGWNVDFQDFFLERIGPDASDPGTARYWALLADWRYVAGGCRTGLAAGAEVLWAYGADQKPLLLRLSGPTRAAVGETVTLSVRDGRVRPATGADGGPVAGAAVGGGLTDAAGQLRLQFDAPGLRVLKAERSDALRSNALAVCVGDAVCQGAPLAPPASRPPAPTGSTRRVPSRAATGRAAARYLLRAQARGGGFGADRGNRPATLFTGWATFALARASSRLRASSGLQASSRLHVATALQRARRALRSRAMQPHTLADLERSTLALSGSHGPADRAARRRWRRAIAARQRSDGAFPEDAGDVNLTAYALLALRPSRAFASHRRRARRWLLAHQLPEGGFGLTAASAGADVDTTGAVLWALGPMLPRAAGRRALAFLRSVQAPNGGLPASAGGDPNAQSTALASIGLQAAHLRLPTRNGATPLHYLRSLARPNGSIAYDTTSTRTPVWTTAQALLTLVH